MLTDAPTELKCVNSSCSSCFSCLNLAIASLSSDSSQQYRSRQHPPPPLLNLSRSGVARGRGEAAPDRGLSTPTRTARPCWRRRAARNRSAYLECRKSTPTTSYRLVTKHAATMELFTTWLIATLFLTGTSGRCSFVVVVLGLPVEGELHLRDLLSGRGEPPPVQKEASEISLDPGALAV